LGVDEKFLLAQLYLGQREEQKYQGEMIELLSPKVRDPRHLAHYVNHWIDRNQLDQADHWLGELKKADPRGMPAVELEARLLDLRKRRPELLALLEAHGRDVPAEIGGVADLLDRYGFAKEAESAYKAFIALDPKQPERSLALAQFFTRHDRVTEAMEMLKQAWSTCPAEKVAVAALKVYDAPSADASQRAQVKEWLEQAIEQRTEARPLQPKLGTILYLEGRFDDAQETYRKVLAHDPDDAESLTDLAWVLAMRDPSRTEEALELINRAIKSYGSLLPLVDTRAVVLIRANRSKEALQDLRDARAGDPANPDFAFHLAWALQDSGNLVEARQEFMEAEKLGLKEKNKDPLSRVVLDRLCKVLTSN
jgi:tetratricopeptide (TPR) repeat protein